MVMKKSEYQNQFKSSLANKNHAIYLENLTFRNGRRNREFIHTPIGWQDQQSDEVVSSDDEGNENSNCNSSNKAVHKTDDQQYLSLAEILAESKAKSFAFRKQKREVGCSDAFDTSAIEKITLKGNCDSVIEKESLGDDGDKKNGEICDGRKICGQDAEDKNAAFNDTDLNHEKRLKSKSNTRKKSLGKKKSYSHKNEDSEAVSEKEHKAQSLSNVQEPSASPIPSLAIGKRPRRPDRQKRVPSANSRPKSQERPPFVVYGAGDKEDTFTTHRTHNVRSTVDVYGAALRAKIRREEEKKRQLEKQRRLAQSTSDLLEKLASATPRDMFDWRSEYQKQFHGYEPKTYERSSSSRAVIPHSAPIRAVHRGGGLIVHVD